MNLERLKFIFLTLFLNIITSKFVRFTFYGEQQTEYMQAISTKASPERRSHSQFVWIIRCLWITTYVCETWYDM